MLDVVIKKQLRDFTLDISFRVDPGKIFVVMGANGSGKSTALSSIAGLIHPDSGYVRLNGEILFDSTPETDLPPEDRRIGYVFQNSAVFPHMTVRENIAFGLRARRELPDVIESRVSSLLKKMDLCDLSSVKAKNLSGGQKQRVALARAIAIRPALLMLDEPFTALDVGSVEVVRDLTRAVISEMQIPCLLVTHRVGDIIEIGDNSCVLSRGKKVWDGHPRDMPECFPVCTCP